MLFSSDLILKRENYFINTDALECTVLEKKSLSRAKVYSVINSVQLKILGFNKGEFWRFILPHFVWNVSSLLSDWPSRTFGLLHFWVLSADEVNYSRRGPYAECVGLSLKLFILSQSFMPLNRHKTLFTQQLTVVIRPHYVGFLLHFILAPTSAECNQISHSVMKCFVTFDYPGKLNPISHRLIGWRGWRMELLRLPQWFIVRPRTLISWQTCHLKQVLIESVDLGVLYALK